MTSGTRTDRGLTSLAALGHRLVVPGWYLLAVIAGTIMLASLPGYALRLRSDDLLHQVAAPHGLTLTFKAIGVLASLTAAGTSIWLAVLLFRRRAANRLALFLSVFLLFYGVVMGGPLEALAALLGFENLALACQGLIAPLLGLLLFLFPSGAFVPRWTRRLVPIVALLGPATFALTYDFPSLLPTFWGTTISTLTVLLLGAGVYAQVYRYRHVSTPDERQRTKWAVYGLCLWIVAVTIATVPYIQILSSPAGAIQPWWAPLTSTFWWLSLTIIPLSFTTAILRHQLFDINLLISRTLVYAGLTAGVISLYILLVGGASALFQTRGNIVISLLATGLIAVIFQPLRERLQHGVNRLLYGERDDPYVVLSRLSRRLETTMAQETLLPSIVETIALTLKLPYAGITLADDARPISYGLPRGEILSLPLTYQNTRVGQLHLARRDPGEPFTPGEQRLLEDIARQAGVIAHAARLTVDLQRSRERLVTAREEERRRLRRDLHDGLGPALASLVLQTESARDLIAKDPDKARDLLNDVVEQAEDAVRDVRQLVHNLRPPVLDDLGLLGALRQLADRLSSASLPINLETPLDLPPLPAAVEVAVYRIAQEALTNTVRHARATRCQLRLQLGEGALALAIVDNGQGLAPDHVAGVGLLSMRERAAELGGDLSVSSSGDGTRITARLPLPADDKEDLL